MGKFDKVTVKNNYNNEIPPLTKESNIDSTGKGITNAFVIPKKNPRKALNTTIKSEHLEFIEELEYELRAKKSDIMDYIIGFFMQNSKSNK